jgi:hypothetical protein
VVYVETAAVVVVSVETAAVVFAVSVAGAVVVLADADDDCFVVVAVQK